MSKVPAASESAPRHITRPPMRRFLPATRGPRPALPSLMALPAIRPALAVADSELTLPLFPPLPLGPLAPFFLHSYIPYIVDFVCAVNIWWWRLIVAAYRAASLPDSAMLGKRSPIGCRLMLSCSSLYVPYAPTTPVSNANLSMFQNICSDIQQLHNSATR